MNDYRIPTFNSSGSASQLGMLSALFITLAFPPAVQASHRPSLRELVDKSQIICTGTVTHISLVGTRKLSHEKEEPAEVDVLNASVSIGQTFRGVIEKKAMVECERERALRRGWGGIYEGDFILFLNKSNLDEVYVPADKVRFFISISKEAAEAAGATSLVDVLRACLRSSDPLIVYWAIDGLQDLGSTTLTQDLKPLTRSNDVEIRGKALLALFKMGESGRFQECLQFIRDSKGTSHEKGIAAAIASSFVQIRDLTLLPQLNQLLLDPDPELRRYASWALADIQDGSSVPYMVQCLLNQCEINPQTQYHCLLGLSRITGCACPVDEHKFVANRERHLREWAEWWSKEGSRFPSSVSDVGASSNLSSNDISTSLLLVVLPAGFGLILVATIVWLLFRRRSCPG